MRSYLKACKQAITHTCMHTCICTHTQTRQDITSKNYPKAKQTPQTLPFYFQLNLYDVSWALPKLFLSEHLLHDLRWNTPKKCAPHICFLSEDLKLSTVRNMPVPNVCPSKKAYASFILRGRCFWKSSWPRGSGSSFSSCFPSHGFVFGFTKMETCGRTGAETKHQDDMRGLKNARIRHCETKPIPSEPPKNMTVLHCCLSSAGLYFFSSAADGSFSEAGWLFSVYFPHSYWI